MGCLNLENNRDDFFINKEKTVFNFNLQGQLISEVDRNGNETTYYYYSNTNRLQFIEDPTGKGTLTSAFLDNKIP